jgi:hypothetical protein
LLILYLLAKPSHIGANVDGLACFLHRPKVYSHQRGGHTFLIGTAPSCHAALGGGAFSRDAKPRGLDIWHGVDCLGTSEDESYMEKLSFTRACLSNIRVIMAIECTFGRVAMSSSDGIDSCTRVPFVR